MLVAIASALEGAPEELAARMRAGVDAFFAFVQEHPFAWRMIFRDAPTDPAVQAAYRRLGGGMTGAVEGFLRASAPAGMFDGPDGDLRAATFAQLLTAAQTGLAFWWYEHSDVPREAVVDRVLEFCWTGLEGIATR
jgi:AcrR family transcriptional regulator